MRDSQNPAFVLPPQSHNNNYAFFVFENKIKSQIYVYIDNFFHCMYNDTYEIIIDLVFDFRR